MLQDNWYRCYREAWKGAIVDPSFSHPAKFARGLIRAVYDHAVAESWLEAGDRVLDPFGGVGLGALDAMRLGLHWTGIELEQKFVDLGQQNIALWDGQFRGVISGWGTAILLQGDSRRLREVVREVAAACVSSPPYAESIGNAKSGIDWSKQADRESSHPHGYDGEGYGQAPGQLGAMSDGDFDACVSSPPYEAGCRHTGGDDKHPEHIKGGEYCALGYDACVSSPPFENAVGSDDPDKRGGLYRDPKRRGDVNLTGTYGESEGQLGAMIGGFEGAVSSPPYAQMEVIQSHGRSWREDMNQNIGSFRNIGQGYGEKDGQLGNDEPETFWSAARVIIEQVYSLLVPGGIAVWVVKDFIRNKERVEFSQQWAVLNEACGFEWLHEHRCWVVEDRGTQLGFFEDEDQIVERKSFFRRLYESKYPDNRIDWESVLCMQKPHSA